VRESSEGVVRLSPVAPAARGGAAAACCGGRPRAHHLPLFLCLKAVSFLVGRLVGLRVGCLRRGCFLSVRFLVGFFAGRFRVGFRLVGLSAAATVTTGVTGGVTGGVAGASVSRPTFPLTCSCCIGGEGTGAATGKATGLLAGGWPVVTGFGGAGAGEAGATVDAMTMAANCSCGSGGGGGGCFAVTVGLGGMLAETVVKAARSSKDAAVCSRLCIEHMPGRPSWARPDCLERGSHCRLHSWEGRRHTCGDGHGASGRQRAGHLGGATQEGPGGLHAQRLAGRELPHARVVCVLRRHTTGTSHQKSA